MVFKHKAEGSGTTVVFLLNAFKLRRQNQKEKRFLLVESPKG